MALRMMTKSMRRKVYQMSTHLHTRLEFVGNGTTDLHQMRFSSTFAGSLLARCTKNGKCDAHDKRYSGKFDRLRAIFEDCFLHDLTEKGVFLEGSIEEYKGLILAKRPKPNLLSVEDFMSWFLRTPEVYKKDIQQLVEKGAILIFGKAPRTLLRHKVVILHNWEKPPPDWDKLNFDGSYIEGGNGILYGAAHASLIRNSSGSVKSMCHGQLPFVRSAFEAELVAALCGLNDCLRVGTEKVVVEGDCDDVIRILQGLDSPRLQYRDIFNVIFEKLGMFKDYRVVHIYRECNSAADGLAYATALKYSSQKYYDCVKRDLDDTRLLFRINQDEKKCRLK